VTTHLTVQTTRGPMRFQLEREPTAQERTDLEAYAQHLVDAIPADPDREMKAALASARRHERLEQIRRGGA
jgi:hypothetical protein